MEGLIITAVIYFVGKMFMSNNEKSKKQANDTMPPFLNTQPPANGDRPTRQQRTTNTRSERPKAESPSLEDFANEVFGQLQKKQATKSVFEKMSIPVEKVEPTVVEPERVEPSNRPVFKNRAELGANRPIVQRNRQKKSSVVIPNTREKLVQAVVMSEVLGKPKAKQR